MSNDASSLNPEQAIAVIGLAGRFPGARDLETFWRNLCDGKEAVSFFTEEELDRAGVDASLRARSNYVRARAVLDEVEMFDADFFGLHPREAMITDPQQRIFLECAWEALEYAAYDPRAYGGLIGIFAGCGASSYLLNNLYPHQEIADTYGSFQLAIGNDKDYLATQVAYKLDLKGPALTIQTACSTSLVAVHLACQSILNGECDMALAGGVSITLPQQQGYLYYPDGVGSPDGRCRAFDAHAEGTFGGNGAGIVLLKLLDNALADGDPICAVIRGSAINNDGARKVGYTAPSVDGQARVIAEALHLAEVDPQTITYIETHGTGTPLGDPIEIEALTQAFRTATDATEFCAIGSVKTNLGHLDAAAGVAGLIKTILALQHRQIPPSLHFTTPNPRIDFARSPFYVNRHLVPWQSDGIPRRAGVSAFGIGGTNAHVIVEEAPVAQERQEAPLARPWQVLTLSARTAAALNEVTTRMLDHVHRYSTLSPADLAYSTQPSCRRAFEHRRIVVYRDLAEARQALETSSAPPHTSVCRLKNRPVVFLFPGSGTQHVNMGRELYETEPVFRAQIDQCAHLLRRHLHLDIRTLLYPDKAGHEEAARHLQRTSLAFPAIFMIEYALAQLWLSWGIQPVAMLGHSLGEYTAACLAGVFSLEDALEILIERGRLFERTDPGEMLSISLSADELQPFLRQGLSLAALNAPSLCTLSGSQESISEVEVALIRAGIHVRRLHVQFAGHSPLMEPVLAEFAAYLSHYTFHAPRIPYISNISGTWITAGDATDPAYWARHARQPVQFAAGLQALLQREPQALFLEVGPGQTLNSLVRAQQMQNAVVLSSLRHPHDHGSASQFLLTALGQLWLAGATIDWTALHAGQQRYRVPLPPYPFQRQRYWIDPPRGARTPTMTHHRRLNPADRYFVPLWKQGLPLPIQTPETLSDERWGPYLLFLDEAGVGECLAATLRTRGSVVISVQPGQRFAHLNQATYTLRPAQPEDYAALFAELQAAGQLPRKILHLWSITTAGQGEPPWETLEACQERGYYSLLFLAQGSSEYYVSRELEIVVLTNRLQNVLGHDHILPAQATLLGPCRVIPREYPLITCRCIDILLEEVSEELLQALQMEIDSGRREATLAYRSGQRWVQTFEPFPAEQRRSGSTLLRQGGVYLITGGLGGIGLEIAEYLARTVQAKLVLCTRTAFPHEDQWEEYLSTHAEHESVCQKIRRLQSCVSLGAELLIACADVADAGQMTHLFAHISARFGALHGVFHVAGNTGDGIIQYKIREQAEAHLAPKVRGTMVLDMLCQDARPDFLLLCSSLNAIGGGLSQVDYCAANACLDAYASRPQERGTHPLWISVNWDTWRAVGMAMNEDAPRDIQKLLEASSRQGMTAAEAIMALDHILRLRCSRIALSTHDLRQMLEPEVVSTPEDFFQQELAALTTEPERYARPDLGTAYQPPRDETEITLAQMWQELLGIERIGVYDNFFDLGGHSLLASRLVVRLREYFQVDVPLRIIFEAPTVSTLAAKLCPTPTPTAQHVKPPLVHLQPEGSKRALFLLHPAGGSALCYTTLARHLGTRRPLYGIQAVGIDGECEPYTSLEAMATYYLDVVRSIQPTGPYLLAGYSLGGRLAFEMARQLRAIDQEIALLAIIDKWATIPVDLREDPLQHLIDLLQGWFGADIPCDLEQMRPLDETARMEYLIDQALSAGKIPADMGREQALRHLCIHLLNEHADEHYLPTFYDRRLTLFRAQQQPPDAPSIPSLGWESYAGGGVEVYEIPGDHRTLLEEPHVQVLATYLTECLDKTDELD